MEEQILVEKIILESKYINKDIKKNIRNKIEKLKGECTEKYGYIMEIMEIMEIIDNKILNNTGDILITVKFMGKILKPKVDMELNATINMVFNHGIFCEYINLPILIPYTKLKDFEYQDKKFIKGNNVFKIGDNINIKLTDIRYHKKKFNCIASLKV